MNDNPDVLRLGIEELAAGISLTGDLDSAKGIINANFGELKQEEERGRLLAANHSLMAKGLIILENDKAPKLEKNFEDILNTMTHYDFSVRLSAGAGLSERILAYYYKGQDIVKHENIQGVAHHLSRISKPNQVIQDGIRFLGIDRCQDFECPKFELPESVLDEAKAKAATKPNTVFPYLKKAGIPEKTAKLLGDDLNQPNFRGNVLRVERKNGGMISDKGFLTLTHIPRFWIFPISTKGEITVATINAGTQSLFKKELSALIN